MWINKHMTVVSGIFETSPMGSIWKVLSNCHSWEWTCLVFWVTPGIQGECVSTESAVQSEKHNGASAGGRALSKGQCLNMMSGLLKTYRPARAVCCTTLAASSRGHLDQCLTTLLCHVWKHHLSSIIFFWEAGKEIFHYCTSWVGQDTSRDCTLIISLLYSEAAQKRSE